MTTIAPGSPADAVKGTRILQPPPPPPPRPPPRTLGTQWPTPKPTPPRPPATPLTSILDAAADKRADAKEKRKAEYAAMVRRVATGKALAARERDDFATLVQELGLSADDVRNDETAARELLRLEARAAKGISNDALREMEIEQLRVIAAFRKAQLHFHGAKPYGENLNECLDRIERKGAMEAAGERMRWGQLHLDQERMKNGDVAGKLADLKRTFPRIFAMSK